MQHSKHKPFQKKSFPVFSRAAARATRINKPPAYVASGITLEDAFQKISEDRRLKILADNNLEPDVIRYLEKQGFSVVAVGKTANASATDEYIYTQATKHKAIIFTHDHDFLNFGRFSLQDSPGVVVIPRRSHHALEHFAHKMPHSEDHWHGRAAHFERYGQLIVYSMPPDTPPSGHVPMKLKVSGYFPQS